MLSNGLSQDIFDYAMMTLSVVGLDPIVFIVSIVGIFPLIMSSEIASSNPVVKAVVEGTAPRPAQLAASRGILPLPQADLLEILVNF